MPRAPTSRKPRRPLRQLRRLATENLLKAALRLAEQLPPSALDIMERSAGTLLPRLGSPFLAGLVRRNMQAAGVHTPGQEQAYLRLAAEHLASALHFFRHGRANAAIDPLKGDPAVLDLARERIVLDDSIDHLRRAVAENRGAIFAAPHATHFLLILTRINQTVPLTVFIRHSPLAHRRQARAAWHRAAGLRIIAEPPRLNDPAARAALLAEALADRQVVVITPDVVQPVGTGVPVDLFNRRVHLGSGVAALAVLTGAPVVAGTTRAQDRRIVAEFHPSFIAPEIPHRRGWRHEAMQRVQQQWGEIFARFLRDHPALWYFWADNRWSRVFRNDPKYVAL